MKYGFLRVAAVAPGVNVADCRANAESIIECITGLDLQGVDLAVFPELSVTAYTCGDLFMSARLLRSALDALTDIANATAGLHITAVVGVPVEFENAVYNCAAVVHDGAVRGLVPKTYLPNYGEFYEKRWFRSGAEISEMIEMGDFGAVPLSTRLLFGVGEGTVGIEICEDLWTPIPPSSRLALAGADVIVNLSASDDVIGKYSYLRSLITQQSARCMAAYVYAAAGFGESSTDLVFDGKAIIAENGTVLAESARWSSGPKIEIADIDLEALGYDRRHSSSWGDCRVAEANGEYHFVSVSPSDPDSAFSGSLLRRVNPRPFVPATDADISERCEEIISLQVAGLARRLDFTRCKSVTIGISGGLDSTLALMVAARTFDRLGLPRTGIIGVTMPGFGTTGRTHRNAVDLMEALGVTIREVSIAPAVKQHFSDIGHDPEVHDVTYENSQARERTQILMDIANATGGMVVGTGDMSELALGWATYNGDHMSMYGVNVGVPKTLVVYLVRWLASVAPTEKERHALLDIADTPISPELLPATADGDIAQRTEDLVGPYELHDFFLYYTLRYGFTPAKIFELARQAFKGSYDDATIKKWLRTFVRRFFSQQFKRSCLPDGPKVGSVCLSPRGDWRMPSDASSASWLADLD